MASNFARRSILYSLLGTYNCFCYGLEIFWQDRLELTQPIDLIKKKKKDKKGCGHRCCDVHSFEKIPTTVDKADGIAFGFPTLRISFDILARSFLNFFKKGEKKKFDIYNRKSRAFDKDTHVESFLSRFLFLWHGPELFEHVKQSTALYRD